MRLRGAVGIAVGLALIAPAGASAGPVEELVGAATQAAGPVAAQTVERVDAVAPVSETLDRAGATAAPVRERVQQTVAPVRQTVQRTVTRVEPAVRAVTAPTEPAAGAVAAELRDIRGAVQATTGTGGTATSPPTADAPPAVDRRAGAGAIDRRASRRGDEPNGDTTGSPADAPAAALRALSAFELGTSLLPAAEAARAAASSTAASGGDALDLDPIPFGGDGGPSVLGGPGGIALAALGLLAAMLLLVPRFRSRLLRMAPARWGSVAYLTPIERPG